MVDIATAVQEAETVRKASVADAPRLARTYARAFFDDPSMGWIVPDGPGRLAALERGFELYLRRLWLEHEETYTTDAVAGVCAWELPGKWKVPVWRQVLMLPALIRALGRHLPRLMRAVTSLESGHPAESHYYLPAIGVDPDWQGRGLGAALMQPMLDRCDREGMPAYLEASTPRSRELYARHGFAVTEEFALAKVGPPLWRMWRAPGG